MWQMIMTKISPTKYYLAFQNPIHILPAISKLENLQTLVINPKPHHIIGKLPLEIWRMTQLRHLIVYYLHEIPDLASGTPLILENLQTLSQVKGSVCSEQFLKMVPNVKKLGLIFDHHSLPDQDHQFHNLARLDRLEKLKVTMMDFYWWNQHPAFPRTLKKLTLKGGGLFWKDMTIIGSLPNLEVLKLIRNAFHGEPWETNQGEFPQLKFLLIENSTLHLWITESSHFPSLKCLILRLCPFLREIPDTIAEIASLEMIEVNYRNKLLVKSAKEIQEDQQSQGYDALQVRIVGCLDESTAVEKTSGKKCYMIGARELLIAWSDTPQYWIWKACAESRFSMVAELINVCMLDIRVKIHTSMLSSNTTYGAYLVFKLAEECYGLESANAVVRFFNDEAVGDADARSVVVHLQRADDNDEQNGRHPVWRDDGWMEVEMGSFFQDDDGGEVEVWLRGIDGIFWKKGLIIEGIEFRPETQFDP